MERLVVFKPEYILHGYYHLWAILRQAPFKLMARLIGLACDDSRSVLRQKHSGLLEPALRTDSAAYRE